MSDEIKDNIKLDINESTKFVNTYNIHNKFNYCRKEYDNIDDYIKEYKRRYKEVFNRLTFNFKVVL